MCLQPWTLRVQGFFHLRGFMTYRQLLELLKQLDPSRLDDNVTVFDVKSEEYLGVSHTEVIAVTDVLDEGHLVLVITGEK